MPNRFRLSARWGFYLFLCACAGGFALVPGGFDAFRFERVAIDSGEWWRLVTGHFVHVNPIHLFLNLLGGALAVEALWFGLPWWYGPMLLPVACIGISGLLWWLCPELSWYAGLSGVLHALWSAGAVAGILRIPALGPVPRAQEKARPLPVARQRVIAVAALVLLVAKLAIEARHGPLSVTSAWLHAPVVYAAHRYGAAIGAVYALLVRLAVSGSRRVCASNKNLTES
ncbi:MAG: rhombosortase [Burkholderiaceae bacterium]